MPLCLAVNIFGFDNAGSQKVNQMSFKVKSGLTKRAVDLWESAASRSIFLASGFSCSQAFSQPAHKPLTQTVGRPTAKKG
jgi:hypothetical protein